VPHTRVDPVTLQLEVFLVGGTTTLFAVDPAEGDVWAGVLVSGVP